jgi:hypothetical protein
MPGELQGPLLGGRGEKANLPDSRDLRVAYPTAQGVFAQRVRNRLKTKELSFPPCKRVRKGVKKKNLNKKRVLAHSFPNWEEYAHTPALFARVANTGLAGYGTWKSVRRMEAALFVLYVGEQLGRPRDTEGVGRTAWWASMGLRDGGNVPHQPSYYSILVPFVNDYFKWSRC